MAVGIGTAIVASGRGATSVLAEELLYYTLSGSTTGGSNGYATDSEIEEGDYTWNATGNTTVDPWRIGGKNLKNVDRHIWSLNDLGTTNITKVVVTLGTSNLTSVNSLSLIVSSGAKGAGTVTSSLSDNTVAADDVVTFERPAQADWSSKYFDLVFNVSAGSSNSYIQFKKAEFYYDNGAVAAKSISVDSPVEINYSSNVKTATLTATKNNGAVGTVTWSIVEGTSVTLPNPATGDSIVVTAVGAGSTTIRATCSDCENPVDVVVNSVQIEHAGTLADPFTAKDAILKAQIQGSTATSEYYYINGLVQDYSWNSKYQNYDSINLVDSLDDTEYFMLFRFYADAGNTKFKQDSLIAKGDRITAVGKIVNYHNTTPETEAGCYISTKLPASLSVTGVSGSYEIGDSPTLNDLGATVTVTYNDGTQEDVTSSATITSGLPFANKGDNEIEISYSEEHPYSGLDVEVNKTVTVSNVIKPVSSVSITSNVTQVNIGSTITLTADALPADANDKTITWSSENDSIATVDPATGVVTGVAAGNVVITASSNNGHTATVTVLVNDPTDIPTALTLTGTLAKSSYYVGESFDPTGLTATVTMSNSGNSDVTDNVTWSPATFNSAGNNIPVTASITIAGETVSDTVTVNVVERAIEDVAFTAPTKHEYIVTDNALDLDGMEVLVEYTLGDIADVTDDCEVSAVDFTEIGQQTVTVTYEFNGVPVEVGSFNITVRDLQCALTEGQQYVLAAYDHKNTKYFELTSFSTTSTIYGEGTQYNTAETSKYPLATSMVFTACKGTIDNSVALKTSDDKYVAWTSGNSLRLNDSLSDNTSWTIETAGDYTKFFNVADSTRQIVWNIGSPRFAAYSNPSIGNTYAAIMLYEVEYCKAGNFVEDYMHPEISTSETGEGTGYLTCKGTGYYDDAKPAFNALGDEVKAKLATPSFEFYPYYQRLLAWADANGDKINDAMNLVAKANGVFGTGIKDENVMPLVVTVAALGTAAAVGFFLFQRKRKEF